MKFNLLSHAFTIVFALNIQEVVSECTQYNKISNNLDSVSQDPTARFSIFVENQPCSGVRGCSFEAVSITYTVPAFLNISTSSDDALAIFKLVDESFSEFPDQTGGAGATAWTDRDGTASMFNVTQFPESMNVIKAGTNASVYWQPYMMTSIGQLSGCSNKSLEGAYVYAASAWTMVQQVASTDNFVVAVQGEFVVNSTKLTITTSSDNSPAASSSTNTGVASQTAASAPTSTHHGNSGAKSMATLLPIGMLSLGFAALL
ncbi:hypothetical protein F5884DRAFT_850591 [Xylogone sp. PMI_703]|nr:hypothetical protein F5884DRAFT_850591 [Xylogone sp. PMI_703]